MELPTHSQSRLAARMAQVQPSAIRELLALGADPAITSFGGGYPSAELFPTEQLAAVYHAAIAGMGQATLQYTVSNGIPELRRKVAGRMAREGVACGPDGVLITQGAQQGLDLVAKLFIDPGDLIVTESPTFLGALIAFNPYQPRYLGVPMDDEGMDTDALEAALKSAGGRVKFLYTVPDFHNPTGVTMSLARRKRLLALASEFDFLVLEDSPYRDIRYAGETIPTLASLDTEGRVIYLGSFSKILAPGLRLGWLAASGDLIDKLGLLKVAADTQCSTLNMSAVSAFLDTFDIEAHIQVIRRTYLRKKNLMLDTMRAHFPAGIRFTDPDGGLFTWVTFPQGFDAALFMRDHAVPEGRVAYVPGGTFFPGAQENNHARFSYSTASDEAIVQGISVLGRLLATRGGLG
ncbi:MAG: PLP-dependent aminotransferase family protein [Pseudomonadota bacterium]